MKAILFFFLSCCCCQFVFAQEGYNQLTATNDPVTITLEDGSKVWLNTKASLGYPATFSGKQKRLELKGEAFFVIGAKPKAKEIKLEHAVVYPAPASRFNINAGDSSIIITSTKAHIAFACNGKTYTVKQGEEAIINNQGSVIIQPCRDIDDIENRHKQASQ